ncbi:hypothetical protein K4K58_001163 [Colletotrichum sp. SAR11_239]|nr:hypothetical protein K4K58_001163 [Colletotrichum sp. SAR11_239]
MITPKSLAASALALLPFAVQATYPFYNPGTLPGNWDASRAEHDGTVQQVTNVVYKGTTALKMTQTYDASYTGRYHSESYNIAQFIANRPGAGCGDDDWMPSSMLWLKGNQLTTRMVSGQYTSPNCIRSFSEFGNLATVSAGAWHTVIIQARWNSDNTGFYKIWFDGAKVLEKYDVATTISNDNRKFAFRVGLYANSWHDDNKMVGSQAFRQIWFDEVSVDSTYKAVDPAQ